MNHLTDETLNEYLDNEFPDRALVEEHLVTCADCAARLSTLQALFAELDSLPEEALPYNIAPSIPLPSRRPALPRSLHLAVTLQAAFAVTALVIAAPFVMKLVVPYLTGISMPTLTSVFLHVQNQWMFWLDSLSTFQVPALPQLPSLEISSLMLAVALAGVSILWLVGNGLLLRKPLK